MKVISISDMNHKFLCKLKNESGTKTLGNVVTMLIDNYCANGPRVND
jgi:hypothetical protein